MPAFLDLNEEMILCEEILLHEETMIHRHQQIEKEDFVMGRPRILRGKLDEGTEKGGVIKSMVKELVNLEEAAIRR